MGNRTYILFHMFALCTLYPLGAALTQVQQKIREEKIASALRVRAEELLKRPAPEACALLADPRKNGDIITYLERIATKDFPAQDLKTRICRSCSSLWSASPNPLTSQPALAAYGCITVQQIPPPLPIKVGQTSSMAEADRIITTFNEQRKLKGDAYACNLLGASDRTLNELSDKQKAYICNTCVAEFNKKDTSGKPLHPKACGFVCPLKQCTAPPNPLTGDNPK